MNTIPGATPTANPSGNAEREAIEWPPLTLAERDALRARAMANAQALRAEAIGEFWRGTDAWIAQTFDHTRRTADRLAARLRQHAKRRAARSPGA